MAKHVIHTLIGLSTAVAFGAALLPAAEASPSQPSAAHSSGGVRQDISHSKAKVCYDRTDDTGVGIVSQNFESSFDAYDTAAAEPLSGVRCKVSEVDLAGTYFNGSGLADSVTIAFYKTAKRSGLPGKQVFSQTSSCLDSGTGSFQCDIGPAHGPCPDPTWDPPCWLSAVANMNFSAGGEWGWETTTELHGDGAVWRNPGDGFATGCTTWGNLLTCVPSGEGPNFVLTVRGKVK